MSKRKPPSECLPLDKAAAWLSDASQTFTTDDLIRLAIERKLVVSLEFVDSWPAIHAKIISITQDEMSETMSSIREGAAENLKPIDERIPKPRIIHDGPIQHDPPATPFMLLRTENVQYLENLVDLFIDATAKVALKNETKSDPHTHAPANNNDGIIVVDGDSAFELAAKGTNDVWPLPQLSTFPDGAILVVRTNYLANFYNNLNPIDQTGNAGATKDHVITKRAYRKQQTQERYEQWYAKYRKLKKENPMKSDTWCAIKIAREEPHNSPGSSAENIRRVISGMKKN